MATILEISDGTTTVELNLAEGTAGFKLDGLEDAWEPVNPAYKGGGTWQQSPMSTGRQIVNAQFENIVDTLRCHVEGATQDECIEKEQDLKRIFHQGTNYWVTDWLDDDVYIKAKADNETNARYAIISTGRVIRDGNPYACRFSGGVASTNIYWMWDLTIVIEHGLWTGNAPGTGTAVEISAVEAYDGRNLGNVDDTGARDPTSTAFNAFAANKRNEANLSDIYVDDGGAFGANLLDAALPYALLPAVPAVNDAVYFGIDTSLADSGPFCSLVFDIGTAGAGYTPIWEYWDGAAWSTLTTQDNTNAAGLGTGIAFDTTGVKSVHWEQPSDWATTAVNGITGYWVRVRVTAIPGALTAPTQQNRNVYSIVWNYTEIQTSQVGGDIPALARFYALNVANDNARVAPQLIFSRLVGGLRSYSRGSDFTSYINISDEQNPAGITISTDGGSAFANDIETATGRVIQDASAGAEVTQARAVIEFDNTITQDFYGQFHVFLLAKQTSGNSDEIEITLNYYPWQGNVPIYSETRTLKDEGYIEVLDFGKTEIPFSPSLNYSDLLDEFRIDISVGYTAAATVNLCALVLIPVDEWACDIEDSGNGLYASFDTNTQVEWNEYIDCDSIARQKKNIRSLVRDADTDNVFSVYSTISNGINILQANRRQRLYILVMYGYENLGGDWVYIAKIENSLALAYFRNQQYDSMRGAR